MLYCRGVGYVPKGAIIHTTYPDGKLISQDTADIYSNLGFGSIACTDHDHRYKKDKDSILCG
ncbi:MAG: hypothetical protein J7L53_10005 [Deltaproteobacteria bacterium]|nr:hypothetical protein [Deltaproteobacteria bacterium]